ncbi:RecX family transcriptional regulator [Sphingomonas sp. S1-29]|uniref:regulatory protein RecX n=1 Tax=Sphingomonas sp. S1-29 TaxID=2991074 RepID=UPI00223E91B3|nr:RecX family transcriptional regulator [Sphingomonas sp. S1-29]UZK69362.1 RecX family transcriptional regulator [Sphingomonas sp. S1-29]
MARIRSPAPPLAPDTLERLALRYVERFATTRAKLATYLARKIRERGWGEDMDPPAIDALVERIAALGYIDDRAFGEARAAALTRRGFGARRVAMALQQAGVGGEDAVGIVPQAEEKAVESALSFARRKRIGPYAREAAERPGREKHMAAMIRAGHAPALSRRIAAMQPLSHSGQDIDIEALLLHSLY